MGYQYWCSAFLAILLIAFSKAGFGGGPGILATPILAIAADPATAIAVALPMMLVCDVWCCFIYNVSSLKFYLINNFHFFPLLPNRLASKLNSSLLFYYYGGAVAENLGHSTHNLGGIIFYCDNHICAECFSMLYH